MSVSYILGIAVPLLTLGVVVEMLRRGRMRERHALWWIVAVLLALIAGMFPDLLAWISQVTDVIVPINLVFFVCIAILFFVCIQHSGELTALESKTRTLAEQNALHELRIHELEQLLLDQRQNKDREKGSH